MPTSLVGQPSSVEVIDRLRSEGRPVMLAFSRGKDSIAAWLALRDAGVSVVPFYLYLVPGLRFEDESLAYFEDHFATRIARYPHPGFYRWLRNLVFQPPDRWKTLADASIPPITHEDVNGWARADASLPEDTWVCDGVRAADSLVRRASMATHGPLRESSRKASPVWDWLKREVMDAVSADGITLPVDYSWFGRSFDGLDKRFVGPLAEHAPEDWARVLEWFPMAEMELFRGRQ